MADETVAEIEARIGDADADELARLAQDRRAGVQAAVAAERKVRGITEESEQWRRAQEATGRPPAHEVAAAVPEPVRLNADPDVLATGAPGAGNVPVAPDGFYDWAVGPDPADLPTPEPLPGAPEQPEVNAEEVA